MAKRTMISEEKKNQFIAACEEMNPLLVLPQKILQSKKLIDMLQSNEIEADMLYKCGCPCDWVPESIIGCKSEKRTPHYCNQCTYCWISNITKEFEETEIDIQQSLVKLNEYEKFRLSPEQMDQIFTALGWKELYDFDALMEKIGGLVSK